MERPQFVALVPAKPPSQGKSRMQGIPEADRARLAAGFALDVATACLSAPSVHRVLAVTDDAAFASELAAAGCAVVPDGVAGDLNETLRLAAREAERQWPALVPVVVCADLPALTAADLEAALVAWPGERPGFVADEDGSGTTLYVATTATFAPAFGHGSRRAHAAAGAEELPGGLATLRRDVDDLPALAAARDLGLGQRTAAIVAGLGALGDG